MATNDTDLSVYASDIAQKASRLSTKASCMVDALLDGHPSLAWMFAQDVRKMMDEIASSARKMSNDYLDDFGRSVFEMFENYQKLED